MPMIPIATGVWPKTSVKDVAESLGIPILSDDAASALAADVEFRLNQIIEESIKFMRHAKRTKLLVEDVDYALRAKNIEPLWGFASTDTLSFRRTTSTAGNLYFVDDEEIDLTKIINAQLPPVPRETSYTAHWLSVEGVQPAIPQNPSAAELKSHPAFPSHLSDAKPDQELPKLNTKQHLSRELRLYFDRVTSASFSDDDRAKNAALASLSGDPGLHQLVPYLVQFVAEKITSNLTSSSPSLSALRDSIQVLESFLSNPHLYLEPYLHQILPSILTCLLSSSFSSKNSLEPELEVRRLSGSLLASQVARYQQFYPTLRSRVLKTLTKSLIEPKGSDGNRLGAVIGLKFLGKEATKVILGQNVKALGECLEADITEGKLVDDRVQHLVKETLDIMSGFFRVSHVTDQYKKRKLRTIPAQDELEAEVGVLFAAKLMAKSDEEATRQAYSFIKESMENSDGGSDEEEDEEVQSEHQAEKMDVDPTVVVTEPTSEVVPPAAVQEDVAEVKEDLLPDDPLSNTEKVPDAPEVATAPAESLINNDEKEENFDDDMVLGSDDPVVPPDT